MAASDFTFAGLNEGVSTVFLCLPPDRLDAYSRWLRLLVAQALTDMARSPVKPARPVLFLLDEFAALGRLEHVGASSLGLVAELRSEEATYDPTPVVACPLRQTPDIRHPAIEAG